MLTPSEIRQLSDRDLADEITKARDALFRQKIGVRTKHLKDTHKIKGLQKYLARLLTIVREWELKKEKHTEATPKEITKKITEARAELEQHQTAGKKKTDKEERLAHEAEHTDRVKKEVHEGNLSEKSTAKVRVKNVKEEKEKEAKKSGKKTIGNFFRKSGEKAT